MEKHNHPIDNDSLDLLLRNFLLDACPDDTIGRDNDIHFTQKEMDMNAAMIFSGQPATALPMQKEKVLLNDLEALLKSGGKKRGWWISGLLILVMIGAAVFYETYGSVTNTPEVRAIVQEPVNGGFEVVPYEGSDGATTLIEGGPFSMGSTIQDSIIATDTAIQANAQVNNNGNFNHTRIHIPEPFGFEEYPVLAPDPVFAAKPSPDNFKVAKGTFQIDTFHIGSTMFTSRHAAVIENYYTGEPFKSGMNDFVYVNYGQYTQTKEEITRLPWQVLCYADTNEVSMGTREWNGNKYGYLTLNTVPQEGVRLATEPFYFGKYEVTNKEYKEFLQWVRTSNGFANKPLSEVKFDTIPSDTVITTGEWVVIKGKYNKLVRHFRWLEDVNKVYRYIYFNPSDELVSELGSQSLSVFPDTLSWIDDFKFSFNEPMSAMYHWHPAYNDYPVVGVSWFQAMAFLDWKTTMHQKQMDVQNVPFMIEYSLPSDIEWELVTLMRKQDGDYRFDYTAGCSEGWMTNLGVQYMNDDAYDRPDYLKNLFTKDQYFRGDFIRDGFFHTGPVHLPKNAGAHIGPLDICWMDGNVSEWMMESYAENWKPFFDRHIIAMQVDKREVSQLAQQIEKLYDKGNASNGRLIRGSNWYDERFGSRPGSDVNEVGISPRRYIDPKEQHSTVGFRYVVRVRYKDEEQRLQ
jgi:formylglycine-generating enzyme required for sulfatase activity